MAFIEVSAGFLILWAIFFFSWGLIKWRELVKLIYGTSVDATIIGRSPEKTMYYGSVESQSPHNYSLTFRYEYGGKEYKETQSVSKNYYYQYIERSDIVATCLPYNPRKVVLAGSHMYRKQVYAKVRTLFALGTLGVLLLVLEIYMVVSFTK